MNNLSRKQVAIILATAAVLAIAVSSMFLTLQIVKSSKDGDMELYYPSSKEHEIAERFSRLNDVYEMVLERYYKEPDSEDLLLGAIDGMLASLDDPYTVYYTTEEMEKLSQDQSGVYSGIGILTSADSEGRLKVLRVFNNSPAREAGIMPQDVLIEADGYELDASTMEKMNESISHIQGENGTFVEIKLLRKDETLNLSVRRDNVTVNRVEYQLLEGNIGYVVLYEFFGDAASGTKEALDFFEEAKVNGVIFDIRSNTGGDLNQALRICDMLLPEGTIIYTEDRQGNRETYESDEACYHFPMVVLIDGNSASASEIFAASMQEYGVAKLVGTKTFGKGIVQTQYTFYTDGAGIKMTTSSYFTASGRSIHGEGIEPDVEVIMWDAYDPSNFQPDMENDNQLKTAYETLQAMISDHP